MFYVIPASQNTDDDKYCAVNSLSLGHFCPKDQKHNTEPREKWPKKSVFFALISFSKPLVHFLYLSTYVHSKETISKWKSTVSQPSCFSFFIYGEILAKNPMFSVFIWTEMYYLDLCMERQSELHGLKLHTEPMPVSEIHLSNYSFTSTILHF